MSFTCELSCDRCDYRQSFWWVSGVHFIRLEPEWAVPMNCDTAWCDKCREVVQAERLIDLDEFQQEFERAGRGGPFALGWWGQEGYWWWLRKELIYKNGTIDARFYAGAVHRLIEWRSARLAPNRCLQCGNTNIRHQELDNDFLHPNCGGRVRRDKFCMASIDCNLLFYDAEGLLLR